MIPLQHQRLPYVAEQPASALLELRALCEVARPVLVASLKSPTKSDTWGGISRSLVCAGVYPKLGGLRFLSDRAEGLGLWQRNWG